MTAALKFQCVAVHPGPRHTTVSLVMVHKQAGPDRGGEVTLRLHPGKAEAFFKVGRDYECSLDDGESPPAPFQPPELEQEGGA